MTTIRVRFLVTVSPYGRDVYDVEPTEKIRDLVAAGLAVIVPYPHSGSVNNLERGSADG